MYSITFEGKKLLFYAFPILYKGARYDIAIQLSKENNFNNNNFEEINALLNNKFAGVLTNEVSPSNKEGITIEQVNISLKNICKVVNKHNKLSCINFYNTISQFDYELILKHKNNSSFININLDNNFFWGKAHENVLYVYGLIINRPKTIIETLKELKKRNINELIINWNSQNPYKPLFNIKTHIKKKSLALLLNNNIFNKMPKINLIHPFMNSI